MKETKILYSILYLEEQGKVKRPSVSIFYTNEYNENYEDEDQQFNFQEVKKDNNYKSNNNFEGIFEAICKVIDTCNNIFVEIKGENNFFLKLPLTVVIVLLIFGFAIFCVDSKIANNLPRRYGVFLFSSLRLTVIISSSCFVLALAKRLRQALMKPALT